MANVDAEVGGVPRLRAAALPPTCRCACTVVCWAARPFCRCLHASYLVPASVTHVLLDSVKWLL